MNLKHLVDTWICRSNTFIYACKTVNISWPFHNIRIFCLICWKNYYEITLGFDTIFHKPFRLSTKSQRKPVFDVIYTLNFNLDVEDSHDDQVVLACNFGVFWGYILLRKSENIQIQSQLRHQNNLDIKLTNTVVN